MASFRHRNHVLGATNWLADAARAAASALQPISVATGVDLRQLILVRYTTALHQTPFNYQKLLGYGAMWCDTVTTLADDTGLITGMNNGDQWKGLQVIRLTLPADYQIGDPDELDCRLAAARCKLGKEYTLRFDVPTENFANIPVDFDPNQRAFIQPAGYIAPIPCGTNQFPSFD